MLNYLRMLSWRSGLRREPDEIFSFARFRVDATPRLPESSIESVDETLFCKSAGRQEWGRWQGIVRSRTIETQIRSGQWQINRSIWSGKRATCARLTAACTSSRFYADHRANSSRASRSVSVVRGRLAICDAAAEVMPSSV